MSVTDVDVPLRPGDLIAGKYRVDRVLGAGGMGVVLEAFHLDLDRKVAVKVVRGEYAQHPELVARMLQEARAAAQIRSEHVCQVLDVGRMETGAPYIVMEFLEGSDLGDVIQKRGPLPVTEAVDYVLQACEALAQAHLAGIVHRDLKPENLFRTRRPDGSIIVKVLDFGISKSTGGSTRHSQAALTQVNSTVGSPHYMSPEQMKSSRDVDARTDIWSLGAILYELTTGRTPFDADTIPGVCAAVMNTEPAPPSSVVPQLAGEFEALILRCLRKNRDERFADVAELAAALSPFAEPRSQLAAERISRVLDRERASGFGKTSPSMRVPRVTSASALVQNAPTMVAAPAGGSRGKLALLAIAGVALVGIGGAVLLLRAKPHAEPQPAARGVDVAVATASTIPARPVTVVEPAPSDPQPAASAAASVASAVVAATAKPPAGKPSKPSSTATKPPGGNAFDTGSFGGRR